jgi:hypothetical protein
MAERVAAQREETPKLAVDRGQMPIHGATTDDQLLSCCDTLWSCTQVAPRLPQWEYIVLLLSRECPTTIDARSISFYTIKRVFHISLENGLHDLSTSTIGYFEALQRFNYFSPGARQV